MKKLIVITRMNTTPGGDLDEFTKHWGGSEDKPLIKPAAGKDISLMVMNGPHYYKGPGKPEAWFEEGVPKEAEEYFTVINSSIEGFIQDADNAMVIYHTGAGTICELKPIIENEIGAQCHEFSSAKGDYYDNIYVELAENYRKKNCVDYELINDLWEEFDEGTDLTDLKEKINLLHLCLTPDNLEEAEKLLENSWNVEDEFKALKQVKTTDAFDKNYISALTKLRSSLKINH